MIPDKKMLMYDGEIGFYELAIHADAIKFYWYKFHLKKKRVADA